MSTFPEPVQWTGMDMREMPSSDGTPMRYRCVKCDWRGNPMTTKVFFNYYATKQLAKGKTSTVIRQATFEPGDIIATDSETGTYTFENEDGLKLTLTREVVRKFEFGAI